jgi:hypothetical protein
LGVVLDQDAFFSECSRVIILEHIVTMGRLSPGGRRLFQE